MAAEFTISSEDGSALVFINSLPANYAGPVLAGANCYSTGTGATQITLQEIRGEEYAIRLINGNFQKRLYAKGWIHTKGLYISVMLENSNKKQLVSLSETLNIQEGEYKCFYTQPCDCSSLFEEDKAFCMLDLFYAPRLLEELLPYFPELKSVIDTIPGPGVELTNQSLLSPVNIRDIASQLLNCPYNETTLQFYFDLKVRELLYYMLESAFNQNDKALSFTPWEVSRIREAKRILQRHIASKPPSIKKLSKLVALNEYKLKKGFQQYFSCGIAQWLQEQKLQHSRHLILNTNNPIKEICTQVGYPLIANFITAFRRRFGTTPGELRRK